MKKAAIALLTVAFITGCTTDENGRTTWDANATWRVVGATVSALQRTSQPQPKDTLYHGNQTVPGPGLEQ